MGDLMPITALYAGLLAIVLLVLTARVITFRRAAKVEIGTSTRDGEDRALLRRVRVHANFVEYTPYGLILMGLAESIKAPGILLHALGATLLVARALHAYALSQNPHILSLRVFGMVLTLGVLAVGAATCLYLATRGGLL
jgi:uncharacterized protein